MDLSALGAVEDADAVRDVVRRFRRRVIVRSAWVVLAVFAAIAIVGHHIQQRNQEFSTLIFEGPSWNAAVSTYSVEGVTIQVQKVTVIPDQRLGLLLIYGPARIAGRLVVLSPGSATAPCPPASTCTSYGSAGVTYQESGGGCAAYCEVYLAIPIPLGRDIPMAVQIGKAPSHGFTVSLDDLEVPPLEGR